MVTFSKTVYIAILEYVGIRIGYNIEFTLGEWKRKWKLL